MLLRQCFFAGWMLHPTVYSTFARINGRKGVIDGWIKFLLQIFASSGCVHWSCSFTQYISASVTTTASFKRPDFMFAAFSNLSFPNIRTASCVYVVVGRDFTMSCYVCLTWLTETPLCSAWTSRTSVRMVSSKRAELSKVSFPIWKA